MSKLSDAISDSEVVNTILSPQEIQSVLSNGDIVRSYRIPWGSNQTYLVHLDAGCDHFVKAVYKPQRGEKPLSDFPDGSLYIREYGAYLLSQSLGWPDIPLTLVRDGPDGTGAIQLYVESDPNITYFDLFLDRAPSLVFFAVFDFIINNADRKAGHCILGKDGTIWSIDHGLTFHSTFKMRTVMLEFWGQPIPTRLVDDLTLLSSEINSKQGETATLWKLFTNTEMESLLGRIEYLIADPTLPQFDPHWNVPWPLT